VRVCLVRHGPAVPSGTEGVAEPDRPLTPGGRKKTARAFEGLRTLELGIDEIWTSPLPRALETAKILARALKLDAPQESDLLLPGSLAENLPDLLKGVQGKAPALVGHEPDLSEALGLCLGAKGGSSFRFRKAGVAVVELPRPGLPSVGRLLHFLAPAVLRALGGR